MSAPFSALAWVRRWEAQGGGWSMIGGKLAFMLPEEVHDQVTPLMAEITGRADRLAAVRLHVMGTP